MCRKIAFRDGNYGIAPSYPIPEDVRVDLGVIAKSRSLSIIPLLSTPECMAR